VSSRRVRLFDDDRNQTGLRLPEPDASHRQRAREIAGLERLSGAARAGERTLIGFSCLKAINAARHHPRMSPGMEISLMPRRAPMSRDGRAYSSPGDIRGWCRAAFIAIRWCVGGRRYGGWPIWRCPRRGTNANRIFMPESERQPSPAGSRNRRSRTDCAWKSLLCPEEPLCRVMAVVRGRQEVRRLAYLALPAPGNER
jgi:hypothetical protein